MSIISKLRGIDLHPDDYVVIGSGILDALKIRESNDVDIVVDRKIFEDLRQRGMRERSKNGDNYLMYKDLEIWLNFDGKDFGQLHDNAILIEGFNFINLETLKSWKLKKGRNKDLEDIKLINVYLAK